MKDHQHSLAGDLDTLVRTHPDRRQVLRWLGLAGLAPMGLIACGGGGASSASTSTATGTTSTASTSTTTTGTTTSTGSASCKVIPEETAGPYPGDGSNSNGQGIANALALSGILRSDIRPSLGTSNTTAQGVPMTIKLQLVNTNGSCAVLGGYAIYLWHCDRDGKYSMYDLVAENYLRGVQVTDSSGNVTFTSIFPGCYAGRIPHVHFEVYPSVAKATSASNKLRTSQFTFPDATMKEAYTATGYTTSVRNLAGITTATDNVFSDGATLQTVAVTGNSVSGYVVTLQVAIAA